MKKKTKKELKREACIKEKADALRYYISGKVKPVSAGLTSNLKHI